MPGECLDQRKKTQNVSVMRVARFMCAAAFCMAAVNSLLAEGIKVPDAVVGRKLQMPVAARLPEANPLTGVKLTVTSDDPSRLLLANAPDKAGSATISITVLPRFVQSPEFWLQGLVDSGTATYTVSAEGIGSAKGTVTLTPAALVIVGPSRSSKFQTTPGGVPQKITIVSAALDSSGQIGGEQQVAGGTQVEVAIASSDVNVGKPHDPKLLLQGGASAAATYFEPAAEGSTTLAPVQPPGFTAASQYATVVATVAKPGLSIVGEIRVGNNLQTEAILCLGEAAPRAVWRWL